MKDMICPYEVLEKRKKKNSRRIRGIDLAFKNTKILIKSQGEATS